MCNPFILDLEFPSLKVTGTLMHMHIKSASRSNASYGFCFIFSYMLNFAFPMLKAASRSWSLHLYIRASPCPPPVQRATYHWCSAFMAEKKWKSKESCAVVLYHVSYARLFHKSEWLHSSSILNSFLKSFYMNINLVTSKYPSFWIFLISYQTCTILKEFWNWGHGMNVFCHLLCDRLLKETMSSCVF